MLKQKSRVVVGAVLMLMSAGALAKNTSFDANGVLVMQSHKAKPKLYQITNIGSQKVALDVDAKAVGVQAGYAVQLDPQHTSVFVYNGQAPLMWSCQIAVVAPAVAQKVSCQTVLKVSNYPTKHLKLSATGGNYWLLENTATADFKKVLKQTLTDKHLV